MEGAVLGAWPFVSRDAEVAAIDADTSRSIVLFGEAGTGKTRLLAEATARAERDGRRVARVSATLSLSGVPFGAFAAVLRRDPHAGEPFEALQRALAALTDDADAAGLLLAVDDAHLLDDASAGLVLLARQSGARVLATVRAGEACPEAVVRLWKDDFALRLQIDAFDEEQVRVLLEAALGAPTDARTAHQLFAVTRGNLLFLRELVRHAQSTDALVLRGGVWSWVAPVLDVPGVRDLVRVRLEGVTAEVREVVDVLAVAEPLARQVVVEICGRDSADEAERAGIAVPTDDGRRHELRLAHPLYAEVVRRSLGPTRRMALAERIADAMIATGARRRDDSLRIVLLQVEAGVTLDPLVLGVAAFKVGVRGDLALAERLARAAIAAGGGITSEVLLGDILYWEARHTDLVELLARELPPDTPPAMVARAALLVASSLFFGLGRFADADEWLQRGVDRVGPAWSHELLGQRAQMLFFAGYARDSIDVARAVLDDPDASIEARLRAYTGGLTSLAVCGRLDEVDAELPIAMQLAAEGGEQISAFTSGGILVSAFIARLFGGGLAEVDALAGAMHADALRRVDDPFLGVWAFLLGRSALARGRLIDAIALLRDSASVLRVRDPGSMLPWALAALAQALGATDDRVAATDAMAELDAVRLPAMRHIEVDIELGRAWAASARGERSLARETAEKIAASLLDDGKLALAAFALHDAVRLGTDPALVVDRIDGAATGCDGPVVAAMAAHVHALVEGDLDGLLTAADRFEAAGWVLHAAEAAAGASRVAGERGLRVRQREAAVRAAELAARCGPALTPMLETLAGKQALGSLTRREQEIALLAARGMSKREIAETLLLSVRTVGNHINHVYAKLGITSRDELRVALDVGV